MRTKGKFVYVSPVSPLVMEAVQQQKQERLRLQTQRAERASRPVPNRICYEEAFANWKPGMSLPHCRRCDATLFPEENHQCPGFVPKYAKYDAERMEARRMEHREAIHVHMEEMREERLRDAYEREAEMNEMPNEAELEAMEEERLKEIRDE